MIHADRLTKEYGSGRRAVLAVRGLNLEVARGEFVALLGPNGAGKSTTLRMLTTLTTPTAGTARVAGADIREHPRAVRRRIGFVGQGAGGSLHQTVIDELTIQARIHGLRGADLRGRIDEMVDAFALGDLRSRRVSELSGGQRRRLDVALGLVHAPRLLFLDEPSTGLDPRSRANLWGHILRMRERHDMTVVVTTHYLEEADDYAQRVVVVDDGAIIADGTAAQLKATLAGDRILLRAGDPEALRAALVGVPGVGRVSAPDKLSDTVAVAVADGARTMPGLLRTLHVQGVDVTSATSTTPTLDDVFLALTGRSLREQEAEGGAAAPTASRAA